MQDLCTLACFRVHAAGEQQTGDPNMAESVPVLAQAHAFFLPPFLLLNFRIEFPYVFLVKEKGVIVGSNYKVRQPPVSQGRLTH